MDKVHSSTVTGTSILVTKLCMFALVCEIGGDVQLLVGDFIGLKNVNWYE